MTRLNRMALPTNLTRSFHLVLTARSDSLPSFGTHTFPLDNSSLVVSSGPSALWNIGARYTVGSHPNFGTRRSNGSHINLGTHKLSSSPFYLGTLPRNWIDLRYISVRQLDRFLIMVLPGPWLTLSPWYSREVWLIHLAWYSPGSMISSNPLVLTMRKARPSFLVLTKSIGCSLI
jgi:hypothetical protein